MNSISLLGYFEDASKKTGEGVRIIDTQIRVTIGKEIIESNINLGSDLLSNLQNVKEQAKNHAAVFNKNLSKKKIGLKFHFTIEEIIDKIEDISYGLPLYALIFCELLNLPLNKNVVGTGAISETGELLPVKELELKENAAKKANYDIFLYPKCIVNQNLSGITVESKELATYIWTGSSIIYKYIEELTDKKQIFSVIRDFLSVHLNELFPVNFGEALHKLGKSNPLIIQALNQYKTDWILNCLINISNLEIQNYISVIQLLKLETSVEEFLTNPRQRQNFIVHILDIINKLATEMPVASIFATASFIQLLNSEISIKDLISSSFSFRQQLETIRDNAANSCESEEQLSEVKRGLQIIGSFLRDLSIIEFDLSNPDQIRKEQIQLKLEVNYNNSNLTGITFTFPDYSDIAGAQLQDPVALFDSSSSLPTKLRRTDWIPAMSMMERLPYSNDIMRRFGSNNLFVFPPMIENGLETKIKWGDGTGTWPPSIDTLHLISVMAKNGIYGRENRYNKVCDLGCGTGVHGLTLSMNSKVDYLDFIDIEPSAGLTTRNNVFENLTKVKGVEYSTKEFLDGVPQPFEESVVRFMKGKIQNLEISEPYDLLICTPPYVPYINILSDPLMWNAVTGTELLNFVIQNAKKIAKKTIIQFSDIAIPEIRSLKHCKVIGNHVVGFRIPPLTRYFVNDERASIIGEKWMTKVKKYMIDVESHKNKYTDHGFRYLHEIKTYLIE